MKKAVIYARYSSSNQREESIEGQLRVCHAYADANGYQIIAEYTDRALSGRTDKRPGFQRMILESDKRAFDAVIVYAIDRFARNRYDSATYKAKLKKNSVSLVSATQPINDSPESIILESVMEGYAEYYSENLSRNVKRGLTENALAAKSTGARLLGYKVENGVYVLDPVESQAVRIIFEMYAAGHNKKEIVAYLNEHGYKTSGGKPFVYHSLGHVLANEKYTGTYIFQNIRIDGGMPQIVSRELYDNVQHKIEIKRRSKGKAKAMEEYLLSGKLYCGKCGQLMVGETGTSKNGTVHHYYKCKTRKARLGVCDKHTERKDEIEKAVMEFIYNQVLTDEIIEEIAARSYELLEKEAQDKSKLVSFLEEMKLVSGRIENLLKAIEEGIITSSTKQRLEDLEKRKSELEVLIVKEQMKKPAFTQEHIIFWLQSFKNGNIDDMDYKRNLIDAFVNSIYVYDLEDNGGKGRKLVIVLKNNEKREKILKCSDVEAIAPPFEHYPNILVTSNLTFLFVLWHAD
jgi:DNA invertase Pin-like site-specific DNA recombinase